MDPEALPLFCPYCGESVELDVDEGGGAHQVYIEDCPVCCRPWTVEATRDAEGVWIVVLRAEDE
jgi:hypothetical protein